MRVIKDITGKNRDLAIAGTNIIVKFKDDYVEVEEKYVHHFEFHSGYEVLPLGSVIPKPVETKEKETSNTDNSGKEVRG